MSLTTLCKRFKTAMGATLHGYVLEARLALARMLLAEPDLSLCAVAERLGYGDVYYFSRQFHQRVGVPPSAFRRSRLG